METIPEKKKSGKSKFLIPAILLALVLFVVVVMFSNSKKPDRITLGKLESHVKGMAFIKTNQLLIEQMYGNWLPNDLFWPTTLLDNMPNFQMGELEVLRYNVRVLRDNLSRMRTTDKLDLSAEGAFTALANDPYKWWFPSAESKWKKAHQNLGNFYSNLSVGRSNFYPRADNLVELLKQYTSLMGGVNTRLINAPRDLDRALAMDEETKGRDKAPKMVDIDIPWYRIDDNFYYSQGVAYALYESFKAIRIDFIDVLKDKNSVKLLDKILENLGRCYFEPLVVFNGDPDSIFANHSLNLSGMFNDARQKVESLIIALMQG
ncbi:MAG: DUF2333 family protein [Deltaproteobacteria bacterium]|nr:DUF2333 family protein [Deltaproteobacteria bacterium]MBW2117377.1 DUF2333 family protein [Deltaproteobacteria bacterium]MBW2343285.1 DUF2333 family protein [Deltaproteobacteria bacterium]